MSIEDISSSNTALIKSNDISYGGKLIQTEQITHDSISSIQNHELLGHEITNHTGSPDSKKLKSRLSIHSFGSTLGSKNRSSEFSNSKLYVPRKHGLCFISSLRSAPSFGFPTASRFGREMRSPG